MARNKFLNFQQALYIYNRSAKLLLSSNETLGLLASHIKVFSTSRQNYFPVAVGIKHVGFDERLVSVFIAFRTRRLYGVVSSQSFAKP